MAQIFKLFRLQQLDNQIDQTSQRLKQIELEINDHRQEVEARDELSAAEETLGRQLKQLHHVENQVTTQRIKLEQNQASLYGGKIRNPKELQDLQAEAASIKRLQSQLEDQQIEIMLMVEEAEGIQNKSQANLKEIETQAGENRAKLVLEKDELEKQLLRIGEERVAAVSTIPTDELAVYENIRTRRKGIAVAKVVDGACTACGSRLSGALLHQARSLQTTAFCDSCGRILYAG